jgi:hypothetical protein
MKAKFMPIFINGNLLEEIVASVRDRGKMQRGRRRHEIVFFGGYCCIIVTVEALAGCGLPAVQAASSKHFDEFDPTLG